MGQNGVSGVSRASSEPVLSPDQQSGPGENGQHLVMRPRLSTVPGIVLIYAQIYI